MEFFTLVAFFLSLITFLKVNKLESSLKKTIGIEKEAESTPPQQQPKEASKVIPAPTGKSDLEKFFDWYAHEWPLKTGALFILLGFVWLVSYAFLNNWVGTMGRISFGLIMGSLILFTGDLRLKKTQSQGITLIGLGAAVITVTVASAQMIYQMFPAYIALGLIFITSVLTATISLRHNILSLSVLSLIIGGLAPILIGSTEKNIFGLYGYLVAVTVGSLWLAVSGKWRILTWISLIIVSLYSLEYFFIGAAQLSSQLTPADIFQLKFFALTFTSLFFFNSLAALATNRDPAKIDFYNAAAVGFFSVGWINGIVTPEYKSIVTIVAALSYAAASYLVFVTTRVKNAVFIYTSIASIMLAIATGYELNGPVLVIAFSMQALLLPIFAIRVLGVEMGKHFFLYFILPFLFSLEFIVDYSLLTPEINYQLYALTAVTLAFMFSGIYFYERNKTSDKQLHSVAIFLLITGAIYSLILIWKTAHASILLVYYARMLSLLVYTLIGLTSYILGEINNRTVLHKFGLGLLIFVVGRLLLVEVWAMELTTRIITFFIIGLLFIGSVLLRKKSQTV